MGRPFRKPSYLFALVAGQLVCREQRIASRGGKEHLLQVYVRAGDLDKTEHAMNSLMASVAWDEARFGLPLDLERFMIVATSDFNMGAMENKGLNIFNTKYVLANQATATDTDYGNIESVVGHEYFHNWTGNRVTCRDWFQLSLKEGLTVFRDQEFSQDLAGSPSARAVKRIEDVRVLRAQFPEDAGPMAHPVRPDQYLEINNFYTVTVYEKGAEVVRMMQTLVGREGFARGLTLYFQRHDGQAVTCDDFAQAIADANPESQLAQRLDQFKRWYSQAGTPRVRVQTHFDAASGIYTLTLSQSCLPTPGQPDKQPFVIPVALGLLDAEGRELTAGMHVMTQASETLTFPGYAAEPVPSLLRGFSAPVILDFDYSDQQLLTLLAHDTDPFNRWEAAQRLATGRALTFIRGDMPVQLDGPYVDAMRTVLRHPRWMPPSRTWCSRCPRRPTSPNSWTWWTRSASTRCARRCASSSRRRCTPTGNGPTRRTRTAAPTGPTRCPAGAARSRAWRSPTCAWPRARAATPCGPARPTSASRTPQHDRPLQRAGGPGGERPRAGAQALQRFHAMFKGEALVLDKWFALQAGAPDRGGNILPIVKYLMQHPDFNIRNPNRARAA